MKILICIPHFYAVSSGKHALQGSSQDNKIDRARSVEYCLTQLLSISRGYHAFIGTHSDATPVIGNTDVGTIDSSISADIVICTHSDNHILDFLQVRGFRNQSVQLGNPKLLGHACRWVFAQAKNEYDLFLYVEDDTAILDPEFLPKICAFYRIFGERKVIMPRRYELFSRLAVKTYLDQPAPPFFRRNPDFPSEQKLLMPSYNGDIVLNQTPEYSSGCYCITREQLIFWMLQSDFYKPEMSAHMDELEQAGGVIGGRYPVYKTDISNASFLEVHHVPNKACNAATPQKKLLEIVKNRL